MITIILNIQTTGLECAQNHRIIEICALELDASLQNITNIFHTYVNPERQISLAAQQINGITDQMLRNKPLFNAIALTFFAFVQNAQLVIHNAPFVLEFIMFELEKLAQNIKNQSQAQFKTCQIIDTLPLCQNIWREHPNNLTAVCRRLNIALNVQNKHKAVQKAWMLAHVYAQIHSGKITEPVNIELQIKNNKDKSKLGTLLNKIAKTLLLLLIIKSMILFSIYLFEFLAS